MKRRNSRVKSLLILTYPFWYCLPAYTQFDHGAEHAVNLPARFDQAEPSIAAFAEGRFVVCWEDVHIGGSRILFKTFSGSTENGPEIQASPEPHVAEFPTVTVLTNNDFVICWQAREESSPNNADIYAQIFDETGAKRGHDFRVNSYTKDGQGFPEIAALPGGAFVICWQSWEQDGAQAGIYGQIFNSSGEKIGDEFRINTTTDNWQYSPQIASFNDDGFVVCWVNERPGGSDIYGQCFTSTGDKRGEEFRINSMVEKDHLNDNHDVAIFANGDFLVCWRSKPKNGPAVLLGQLFESPEIRKGSEFNVSADTSRSVSGRPAIVPLRNDDFALCWRGNPKARPGELGLRGQLFDHSGDRVGMEFIVLDRKNTSFIGDPVGIPLADNGYVLSWSWRGDDWDLSRDVYYRYFLKDAITHGLQDFALTTPANQDTLENWKLDHVRFNWESASEILENYSWEIVYDMIYT